MRTVRKMGLWWLPVLWAAILASALLTHLHRAHAAQPSGIPSYPTFQAVGIGTSPKLVIGNGHDSLLVKGGEFFSDTGGLETGLTNNIYNDGTDWRYLKNGPASTILIAGNTFYFFTAPSGTAGAVATLTQNSPCLNDGTNCPPGATGARAWGFIVGNSGGCTITAGLSSGINGCTRQSTGAYQISFVSGLFTSYVICTATPYTAQQMANYQRDTAADGLVELESTSGFVDGNVNLTCMGV